MAEFTLAEEKTTSKEKLKIPALEGVRFMLSWLKMDKVLKKLKLDSSLTCLALGHSLLKGSSESDYLKGLDLTHLQRRFNRFFQRFPFEKFYQNLLVSLPKSFIADPNTLFILDDSPLSKSGKKMNGAKKFFTSVRHHYFFGYELVTLALSNSKACLPLGFSLRTSQSSSKLILAQQLIKNALSLGFSPRFVVFDCWYTVAPLISFFYQQHLSFLGPVKKNRFFFYKNSLLHAHQFIPLLGLSTRGSFPVVLQDGKDARLIVFKRHLSSMRWRYEILLTNDLLTSTKKIILCFLKRWNIEVLFRSAKQSFGLNSFHNRRPCAIRSHITLSFSAMSLTAFLKTLFRSLHHLSLAAVRSFVLVQKICRTLYSSGFRLFTIEIRPNPLFFNRFGLLRCSV